MKANTQPPQPQPVSYPTTASCHCGRTRLPVALASQTAVFDLSPTWQKLTGTLIVFYTKLFEVPDVDPARTALSEYTVDDQQKFTAYFCKTCSAHICFTIDEVWFVHTAGLEDEIVKNLTFQWVHSGSTMTTTAAIETDDGETTNQETPSDRAKSLAECVQGYVLPSASTFGKQEREGIVREEDVKTEKESTHLHGSCYCGSIRLRLTRPTAQSYPPYTLSPFPDFLRSFYETPMEELNKPADTAWWIIDDSVNKTGNGESNLEASSRKFIAAFCSCTSCRKIAGSELQQWAFLPESCLSLKYKLGEDFVAWPDFWPESPATSSLPVIDGNMTIYESSRNVIRGSCRMCGASIFWNGRMRQNLVDVSAGLFVESHVQNRSSIQKQCSGDEGILDDKWFKWSIDRLSFVEDAKCRIELVKHLEEIWKTAAI